ncbi:MAG: hypothetical protein GX452_14135 [Ignavibacteriales bacterium]|jgi:hypothetical protein|nr:hypothetical protein [Ignavibacteriaceae bacterium]NLH62534.1 hypothetical protein [Ignavibacteriales bacterium]HOJ19236.1 hypothetical protein [Ignavibacteriaceae bacterium]HPO56097.1 hypothetical protein [Ignavibacteriaceae bacterium]
MITKSKKNIRITTEKWAQLKKSPALTDALELLEDISDLEKAKKEKGKSLTIDQYLAKRGLSN